MSQSYTKEEVRTMVVRFRAILKRDKTMTVESKVRNLQALHDSFYTVLEDDFVRIMRETQGQFPDDAPERLIYRVHDILSPDAAWKALGRSQNQSQSQGRGG